MAEIVTDLGFFTGITSPYYPSNCDQVTDWSGGPTLDSVNYVQGGAALSAKVSKAVYESVFTLKNAVSIKDKVIIVWAMCSGRMDTHPGENGYGVGSGFRIRVYEGTNWGEWDIAGRNTWAGGWTPWMVHANTGFSRNGGVAPNLDLITKVGVVFETVGSAVAVNCWWDALRIGTYIGVKGAGANLDYIITQEEAVANKWGACWRFEGLFLCQTKFRIGATGESTTFLEAGEVVIFPDRPVPADFYTLELLGNASVKFGSEVGGAGVAGVGFRSAVDKIAIDASVDTLTALGIYGSTFFSPLSIALPPYSATREVLNTNFENYGDISLNTCSVRACNFIAGQGLITAGGGLFTDCNIIGAEVLVALFWNVAIDTLGKLNGTSFVSGGAGHAIELGPNTPSEISLLNVGFSSYATENGNTGNEAIYNNSGKHIVINVSGGTVPTYRNGSGATTEVVPEVRKFSFAVMDEALESIIGYEWRLYKKDPTLGKLGDEIIGEEYATESEQSYVYPYGWWGEGDLTIVIQIIHHLYEEAIVYDQLKDADKSITIILKEEVNI